MLISALDLADYPALHAQRAASLALIARFSDQCIERAQYLSPLCAIAAAGSVGRLEVNAHSDLDCLLIVPPNNTEATATENAISEVMRITANAGLRIPKAHGIYRNAVSVEDLCRAEAKGNLTESPHVFGKRIQFLLDARGLWGDQIVVEARAQILTWYFDTASDIGWEYLARDLIRYANSYTNWQRYQLSRTHDDSWLLRRLKLRSSRFVTWLGLWVLLRFGIAHGITSKGLSDAMNATPLERIASIVGTNSPAELHRFLSAYDLVATTLDDEHCRHTLLTSGPDDHNPDDSVGASVIEAFAATRVLRESAMVMLSRQNQIEIKFPWFNGIPF